MMRILVLIYEFPPIGGGGGRVAQDLCQGFAKNGHDVRVLTADLGGIQDNKDELGFSVIRIPSGRQEAFRADLRVMGGYVLAGFWMACKVIKSWKPDLIHVHFAVPSGPLAWLLSKIYRIPYVLTVHLGDIPGGAPEKTDRWFRWIFPFTPPIWKGATRVVAVSNYSLQLASVHYPVDIEVIPNGVDTQQIKPKKLVHNKPPRMVFAGRFMEQKNPFQVVRVLAGLKHLPWSCIMLGDGPLRPEVEKEIVYHQLGERFVLKGWVETTEVLAEFTKSEILFMPSRSEGLPVVGVQALASGMAIVAGDVGGFRDVVEPGLNGYLFNPDDIDGMQKGLKTLLENPETLVSYRKNSLKKAKNFDLADIVASYERLFQEVVQG
jgi:glycosyltransferase involved in cell wall biosynthesis